jgi:hypothetical protein
MSADTLRHSLFVYGSDDELASRMVPFLAAGLDADELVAIVATPPHRALLEDALGDGSDDVAFFDPLEHYTRPEAALAGYDRGLQRIRAGRVDGRFVCELSDGGPGHDDPLAGFTPPRKSASCAGLWIARQLSDDVELISDPGGLTARLWAAAS